MGGCTEAGDDFSYFTVLTYWGLGFYFLVSAVHTFTYAYTGTALLDRFPRALQALHSFYYTSAVVFPFVVTIVYCMSPPIFPAPLALFSALTEIHESCAGSPKQLTVSQ